LPEKNLSGNLSGIHDEESGSFANDQTYQSWGLGGWRPGNVANMQAGRCQRRRRRAVRDAARPPRAIAERGARFRSLGDAWADTTTAHGRVANGVKMGRKPKLTPHQKCEAIRRRDRGEDSLAEIGRSYNVSGWTISRLTT
jgi:CENP-B N-terminal DNA-binding domain